MICSVLNGKICLYSTSLLTYQFIGFFFFFLPSFTINVKILYVLNIQLLFPASWLDTLFFPCQDMADYKSKGKVGGGVSAGKAKSRDDDDDDDDDDDEEEEDEDDEEDD